MCHCVRKMNINPLHYKMHLSSFYITNKGEGSLIINFTWYNTYSIQLFNTVINIFKCYYRLLSYEIYLNLSFSFCLILN